MISVHNWLFFWIWRIGACVTGGGIVCGRGYLHAWAGAPACQAGLVFTRPQWNVTSWMLSTPCYLVLILPLLFLFTCRDLLNVLSTSSKQSP